MAVPTRPVQDGIIDPVWGQWVHDHQISPKRIALWRTTTMAFAADGANAITYEQKDDPYGLISGSSQIKAPAAGLMAVSACCAMAFSGGPANLNAYLSLTVGGAEVRRGNGVNVTAAQMPPGFTSVLSGLLVVAANDLIGVTAFASGPGVSKSAFGGRAYNYLEAVFLTAY